MDTHGKDKSVLQVTVFSRHPVEEYALRTLLETFCGYRVETTHPKGQAQVVLGGPWFPDGPFFFWPSFEALTYDPAPYRHFVEAELEKAIEWLKGPLLWPQAHLPAIFYFFLTGYELVGKNYGLDKDRHGRYRYGQTLIGKKGLHGQPFLHQLANKLAQVLKTAFPQLPRRPHNPRLRLTFDIDAPFRYGGFPFPVALGKALKAIAKGGGIDEAAAAIKALLAGKDPFDTFGEIAQYASRAETHVFWLMNREREIDGMAPRQKALEKLVLKYRSAFSNGIHPSYFAMEKPQRIGQEKAALEQWTGQSVKTSRMHFLKYEVPGTFSALADAGIETDYSVGCPDQPGYAWGFSRPVQWFDPVALKQTKLHLCPTVLMDRTLRNYRGMTPGDALSAFKALADITFAAGADFTVCLHNDTLSGHGDWREWRNTWAQALDYAISLYEA